MMARTKSSPVLGRGYGDDEVVALVLGDGVAQWPDLVAMLATGTAQVLVVARPEHLPPGRLPRLEVATPAAAPGLPRARRPRVVPRMVR